ncbi:serine hydrolase domain-containing protein [Chryseolinea lacunae]|uniref:Serine hydrolase n=1 Tax=Chryseolinea lacunae TaxID=2801331 RepID=A0ABS1KP88_9BACT|nr:serine hydrolase domain-containing protein [Chryseolinea lacunae]MBL0741169.1 serine hydrolase [Chryseolinea lacunae]
MKRFLLHLLAIALLVPSVYAQKIVPAATPEAAGFSTERLKRLDAGFNEWVNKGWINGAVALVIRDGKTVYYKGFGFNDPATKTPLAKDGIFRIASQTKAITSVAAMMLFEEGKFLLDDPISKFIPSFAHAKVLDKFNDKDSTYTTVPAKRDITVRDLLTHTSGLGYAQIGSKEARAIYHKQNITAGLLVTNDKLSAAMTRLGALPLMHQPGEKWTYGLNSDLLGYLVEVWSGMSLDDFFRTRIFGPLGMNDTYFNVPAEKASRLVNFFVGDSLDHIVKTPLAFGALDMSYPLTKKNYFSGGGGLSSTIYDYGVFLQMLLNGGVYDGARLLSPSSVRLMTMNQIGDLSLGGEKFGLGFGIVTEAGSHLGPMRAGTYAWGGAFSTTYFVDPASKMVVLLYRQMWGDHMNEIEGKFKVLVYQAFKE